MTLVSKSKLYISVLLAASAATGVNAETINEKIMRLERSLDEQQSRIAEQEAKLKTQAAIISEQKASIDQQREGLELLRYEVMMESRGASSVGLAAQANRAGDTPLLAANETNSSGQQKPVGQAPDKVEQAKPDIVAISDIGGVLTPRGKLIIEPTLEYSHTDVNRLTFRGIEILSSLGIGILEAVDADRDTVTASITGRLGLTNRLELELKIPYVWRDDDENATIPQLDPAAEVSSSLEGNGIGDIEIALHYQLNSGQNGWPFFIANGRLKLNNGEGPFDISRDSEGIGRELATGSGFYSFEPSITALFPSAPAVFFANLGYLINIEDDVDEVIGPMSTAGAQTIGKVDPGDAFRFSFGMAYSVNERASFTLGFKTDWIQESDTEINGVTLSSSDLTVGSMLLGYSYQFTRDVGLNVNLELGITDDAPDLVVSRIKKPAQ